MLIPNKHEGYSRDGRRLYYFGDDSGGGGGAAAPMDTTYQHQIPHFAPEIAPYAQTLLGQAAALTDTDMNPYMQYQGERNAQFSPLQNQSYQNMALMQSQPQLQDATALAGQAGLGALNTQYTFDPSNFNKAFSAANTKDAQGKVTGNTMMNPYMDNVVARQQQDAQRQADIAGQSQQAQAARSGAFGGSGDYLMRGQAAGNLARQKGDIQAQGLNNAYNQAMQQYNTQNQQNAQQQQYGAGLGLQGLQMANQSAQNLGTLGGLQYQQNMGINQQQNQYGLQQQAQVQQDLTNKYQDYLNSQNYPYKQMGFMSDMIRGLPLASQSTQSMYPQASAPSTVQTLAGLGGAAYGFGKSGLFGGKEGGLMTSYAEGGVTSQQNVESILSKLSDRQLVQAKKTALARQDVEQANMIDAEMAERSSIRGGLGGAFNQIPEEQQEQMMAGGGIVAFAGGGSYLDKAEAAQQKQMDYISQATTQQTPEQQKTDVLAQREVMKDLYGPSLVPKYLEEVKAERTALPEKIKSDEGLAFAMSSLKLLTREPKRGETQKQQFVSGLGQAGEAFAGEVGRLKKEHKEADRFLRQSEMQLTMADQLYNNGLTDKAMAKVGEAQALKAKGAELHAGVAGDTAKIMGQLAGTKLSADASKYAADVGYQGHVVSATATMNKPSAQMEGVKIKAAEIKRQFPDMPDAQVKDKALQSYLAQTKTGMGGVDARIEATAREKAAKDYNDAIGPGGAARKEYKKIQKEGTLEQVTAFEEKLFNKYLGMHTGDTPQPAPNAPAQPAPNAPAQQQQAAPIKVTSQEQFAKLPSGTTFVAPDGSVRVKP